MCRWSARQFIIYYNYSIFSASSYLAVYGWLHFVGRAAAEAWGVDRYNTAGSRRGPRLVQLRDIRTRVTANPTLYCTTRLNWSQVASSSETKGIGQRCIDYASCPAAGPPARGPPVRSEEPTLAGRPAEIDRPGRHGGVSRTTFGNAQKAMNPARDARPVESAPHHDGN
jgi:hypothetical protein